METNKAQIPSPSVLLLLLLLSASPILSDSVPFPYPFPDHSSSSSHSHSHPPPPPPPISSIPAAPINAPVVVSSRPISTDYGNPVAGPIGGGGGGGPSQPAVAIISSEYNAPTGSTSPWNYSFEASNGIRQSVEGSVRSIGNEPPFVVMRGSYSYIGPDGQEYVVDWFADETGYHPSAPHLPEPVEIPFPEQAAAVAEQIRHAREEQEAEDQQGGGGQGLPSYVSSFGTRRTYNKK